MSSTGNSGGKKLTKESEEANAKTCGWCSWNGSWATKNQKLRKRCIECGTISYCDNICLRKHRDIHGQICQVIIKKKGRGPTLDKLFDVANRLMIDNKLVAINNLIEKHIELLNWTVTDRNGLSLMHSACQRNKVDALEMFLLKSHADPNLRAKERRTPLMDAALKGDTECMALLLDPFLAGAEVDAIDTNGRTALHHTSQLEPECIPLLVAAGADKDRKDNQGCSPIHLSAMTDTVRCVELLVEAGADVNAENIESQTPLHVAAQFGSYKCIPLLVKSGANLESLTIHQVSPLLMAVMFKRTASLRALIDQGADVNSADLNWNTALFHCAEDDSDVCASMLIDAGINMGFLSKPPVMTAIHLMCRYNAHKCLSLSIKAGADIHVKDAADEATALHYACREGASSCIQLLLNAGANIHDVTKDGNNCLHIAAQRNHAGCIKMLIEAGLDVNSFNNNGNTPLHVASQRNHKDLMKVLIDAGADVDCVDDVGNCALSLVSKNDCKQLLIESGAIEI